MVSEEHATITIALSPNGKATDSDSVISRFESLQRCSANRKSCPFHKKLKKVLTFQTECNIIHFVGKRYNKILIALSPNGKATDSDSVISRFESLQRCQAVRVNCLFCCVFGILGNDTIRVKPVEASPLLFYIRRIYRGKFSFRRQNTQ